jgi:hypothetical protein
MNLAARIISGLRGNGPYGHGELDARDSRRAARACPARCFVLYWAALREMKGRVARLALHASAGRRAASSARRVGASSAGGGKKSSDGVALF